MKIKLILFRRCNISSSGCNNEQEIKIDFDLLYPQPENSLIMVSLWWDIIIVVENYNIVFLGHHHMLLSCIITTINILNVETYLFGMKSHFCKQRFIYVFLLKTDQPVGHWICIICCHVFSLSLSRLHLYFLPPGEII